METSYKYTFVIPTCNRWTTLPAAVDSALSFGKDVEVVVSINGFADHYKRYLSFLGHRTEIDRLKVSYTDSLLSMLDNFELGPSKASGKYVTCIDDDDAIVPSARRLCDQHFELNPLTPLAWYRKVYFWNNAPHLKNLLFVEKPKISQNISRQSKLEELREKSVHYNDLPSFYNAFHPIEYLKHLRSINKHFFASETIFPNKYALTPDVFSAVQSIYCMETDYTLTGYPVSLSGISQASNGANFQTYEVIKRKFVQDSQISSMQEYCKKFLVASDSMQMINGSTHAFIHKLYTPLTNFSWQPSENWIENLCQAYIYCEAHQFPQNSIDFIKLARQYNVYPKSLAALKQIYRDGFKTTNTYVMKKETLNTALESRESIPTHNEDDQRGYDISKHALNSFQAALLYEDIANPAKTLYNDKTQDLA